nr:FKBP-type peptidyl-prolyl cis-trans isomerase [Cryobacterium roopkundense]
MTGCSAPGTEAANCEPTLQPGTASDLVSVTGDFGAVPVVDFPNPLKAATSQLAEVIPGTGAPVVSGQKVKIDLSVYNGTTGEVVTESAYNETSASGAVVNGPGIKGLTEALSCAQVGSRLAVVVPPADAFGAEGNADAGIAATDTIVLVIDVVKSYLTRADGADQPAENGLPAVVLAEDGTPGITIPSGTPPAELQVGVLKKGTGAEVQEGDPVTIAYSGLVWGEKTTFESTWESGIPTEVVAIDGSQTQGGLIPGFAKALIGQTVGSQLVAVIPPDLAYGEQGATTIPPGSTLVYVVDILGVN